MNVRTPGIWILLLLPVLLLSQTPQQIDSVQQLLNTTSAPDRIVELSSLLWSAYIDRDIDRALQYAENIIRVGEESRADTILSDGYQKKGVCYAYLNQFDSSGVYFREAINLYEKVKDYEAIASTQRNLGQDYNMIGQLDSASYYYRKARENFAKINDSVGIADIYNSEAIVYYIKGYYNLAFNKAIKGEEIFTKHEELAPDLNQNRLVIASIYSAMKDTLNAIDYFQKTIDYFKEQGMKRQYASNAVLLADLLIPNYQSNPAVASLIRETVEVSQGLKDIALINNARLAQAALEYEKGNYQEAKKIQSGLVSTTLNEGQEYLQAVNTLALGKTMIITQEYSQAIEYLKKAEVLSNQLGMETIGRDAQKLLAQSYEAMGDYQNSLAYFKQYKALDEKIYNQERTNRFDELQTIYETEKKESAIALQAEEIKTLNAQAKADRLTKTLYATGMASFVLISGGLFFGFRQRMKKNRIEREKQEAIYQQELAFKKKELASQTLHLVQKNTFIQELKENLERIKQSPELFKVEFRKLVLLLRRQSAEDKTWEVFKSYFSEVHNDFDHHLKSIAQDLTENDIRLASFLRMNLTTKEIASLLNVLPDSVLKSKYRLKKKLGLSKEQDLGGYLNTL
jgi:tetratricopeptide (TPR) repeat protein/DNA-binding CsgD family transcriptional regulator